MKRTANPEWKPSKATSLSPWVVALKAELGDEKRVLGQVDLESGRLRVTQARDTLWAWADLGKGGIALRLAYAPGGIQLVQQPDGVWGEYVIQAVCGTWRVELSQPDPALPMIAWRTTVTPSVDLMMPWWPKDLIPVDAKGDPLVTQGIVHATQRGPKGGMLYATLTKPEAGSFLYMQDLTSLNAYCEATKTQPFERVGGEWPALGFSLPPSDENPLPKNKPVVISDGRLRLSPELPKDHLEAARLFLDLFADVYLTIQRPPTQYHDWLQRAEDTLRDLAESEDCTTTRRGLRYFNAYVGTGDRPPESMVQLAVLMPILDYLERRGAEWPMAEEIKANLGSFFNPSVGTLVRWLPGDEFDKPGEHKDHHTMDAWYLYHTLLNTGRLALKGHEEAKRLLLASLPYAEGVAKRYNYKWPIFYDVRTKEPIKQTSDKGFGETDVAGLYALVMLQAYDLTGDRRWFREAERAARTLTEFGFQLAYQFNSTVYGAVALARLWREAKNDLYRDISYVCIANFLHNTWLWQCEYGHGKTYPTFMGLPPLHDAPYIAIYEEEECLEAFASYLQLGGDELPASIRMMLPEFAKYVLHRSWYAYPSELPAKILSPESNDGHLDRRLAIPLEDLGDGYYPPGKVGQEIYGAGGAPLYAAWAYHAVEPGGFLVFSEYIATDVKVSGDKRSGRVRLAVQGDPRLTAKIRMIPDARRSLPSLQVYEGNRREPLKLTRDGTHREATVRGGQRITIEWGSAKK